MYATLRAAARAAYASRTVTLHVAVAAAARAALFNARGNSGAIFAALLDGFSRSVRGADRADVRRLAAALQSAATTARAALAVPVDGTMLSVADAVAAAARDADELTLLGAVARAADEAVDRTPQQLAALARAGVVDAGAAGLAYVFGAPTRKLAKPTEATFAAPDARRALCVACTIEGTTRTPDELRGLLEPLGDSIVVAGAPPTVKLHVHASDAEAVRAVAASCGAVRGFAVDDMMRRHDVVATASRARSHRPIALVTDSTSDLLPARATQLGVAVVPLFVVWGSRRYRDGIDISRAEFYDRLARDPELPATSQPTPAMFEESFAEAIARGDDVLCLTISSRLSGTANAAHAARQRFPNARIEIFDSHTVSGGLAMMVERASEAIAGGDTLDDVLEMLSAERDRQRLYACLRDLSFPLRTGRISKAQAFVGTLAKVLPVLTINDGAVEPAERVRSFARAQRRTLELTLANAPDPARSRYCVMHVRAPDVATHLRDGLLERFAGVTPKRLDVLEVGPIIAAHGGPGAAGIFSIEEA